jgi:MtN3 and saliva related transmembrane protein
LTENLFGYFAAACTTIAFIPQAIKVHKTKEIQDISLGMFALTTIGVLLWFIYGIMISSLPVIIANFITFILSLYIFIMKIKLDHPKT